jgi:hypothetical protein
VKGKTMKKANDQYLSDFDDRLRASGHGQAHPIELGLGPLWSRAWVASYIG